MEAPRLYSSGSGSGNPLARVLASGALADLVLYFVLHPDGAPHFRGIQRATGLASRSLQHELARLEELGVLERERDGRMMRYRRAADRVRWDAFRELVRQFAQPRAVLRTALAHVPGIQAAFIYGSFARGDMDERSDIDVFALGEALEEPEPELALAAGTVEASVLLGHEVNVVRYTPDAIKAGQQGGFLRSVLAGPKQWLVGNERVLTLALGGAA